MSLLPFSIDSLKIDSSGDLIILNFGAFPFVFVLKNLELRNEQLAIQLRSGNIKCFSLFDESKY